MIGCILTITVSGVEHSVPLRLPDIVAFEQRYGIGSQMIFNEHHARTEWEMFLAWHALRRTGATDLEFEAWQEGVESDLGVALPPDKVGAGPLVQPPPPEESPDSS